MNSVQLIGNLVRGAEAKTFSSGARLVQFSLEFNTYEIGKSIHPCFIEVECWGGVADLASTYLAKGSRVAMRIFATGKLER